jgi:hypothetical protein
MNIYGLLASIVFFGLMLGGWVVVLTLASSVFISVGLFVSIIWIFEQFLPIKNKNINNH